MGLGAGEAAYKRTTFDLMHRPSGAVPAYTWRCQRRGHDDAIFQPIASAGVPLPPDGPFIERFPG